MDRFFLSVLAGAALNVVEKTHRPVAPNQMTKVGVFDRYKAATRFLDALEMAAVGDDFVPGPA